MLVKYKTKTFLLIIMIGNHPLLLNDEKSKLEIYGDGEILEERKVPRNQGIVGEKGHMAYM